MSAWSHEQLTLLFERPQSLSQPNPNARTHERKLTSTDACSIHLPLSGSTRTPRPSSIASGKATPTARIRFFSAPPAPPRATSPGHRYAACFAPDMGAVRCQGHIEVECTSPPVGPAAACELLRTLHEAPAPPGCEARIGLPARGERSVALLVEQFNAARQTARLEQ